jgi:hypothetical protein
MQQAEGTNPLGRGQNVRGNGTVFGVAVVISDMAPNMRVRATFHQKSCVPHVADTDGPFLVDGRTIGVRCQKRVLCKRLTLQFTGDDP